MNVNYMIPEVLADILRRVDNPSLVSAARVCRAWSEVALDLLYHTIERDQWTHESFTRFALTKNAFRIREFHCSYYDDITPFYQGLVKAASANSDSGSSVGATFVRAQEEEDGRKSVQGSRKVLTMNQLRVFECPAVTMNNAAMILDILKFNPSMEKLVLILDQLAPVRPPPLPFLPSKTDGMSLEKASTQPKEGEDEATVLVHTTLLRLLTEELHNLRELVLRDWAMAEGDMERLMASKTLCRSLRVLELDSSNDGWHRSKLYWQPQYRRQMRRYRDSIMALPQERTCFTSNPANADPFQSQMWKHGDTTQSSSSQPPPPLPPWSQLHWLKINGFPEGSLTLFKITRWCPNIRTLVLGGDSAYPSLFPDYQQPLTENDSEDEEEEEDIDDDDIEGDGEGEDNHQVPLSSRQGMLISLPKFRNTLRAHCPKVETLLLENIGFRYPAPLKYLLKAFSPTMVWPNQATVTTGTTPPVATAATTKGVREGGLKRFEVSEGALLPVNVLKLLIKTVAPSLQTVAISRGTRFYHHGGQVYAPRPDSGATILDLLRKCPALVHVDLLCPFWRVDTRELLALDDDGTQWGAETEQGLNEVVDHSVPPSSFPLGSTGDGDSTITQQIEPSSGLRWACHDTLETLKCRFYVQVPAEEEMEYGLAEGTLNLPTGRRIKGLVLQFLDSLPRLQYRLDDDLDMVSLC
ncbi:hypothetical protein BGW41_005890 [Actinomortierella wolfii]|nr:hypothetical protein BGW41_005890 [Actinomortierella wolfii]